MYDSLPPYEPQHARTPWPSPTPGVHPNPCPLSQWCHPTISSSVIPFSSCPQSFPASGSFTMSQLFASGSVQFSQSVVSDSLWHHELQHARPPCPSPTLSLPKLMSIELVMPSNHPIPCHPLLLLPSIFPSLRVFSNESALRIRWPKYWSFSFSISPSNEHPGLISVRMDWFDLLAVQGTLKGLFQHHSSKALILQHSAFFMVQLSCPYMTIRKTIALTKRNFVGKVMSLLFNMVSRFVIAFLPRSKRHLFHGCSHYLQWFWSPRK